MISDSGISFGAKESDLENPLQNETETDIIKQIEKALPEGKFYWFFLSLFLAVVWTLYLAYYNSRVLGLILTLILNRFKFVKYYGHVQFGSVSFSVLSGKIMFRAVHLINHNFSIRVEYGWIIFKWWRPYISKDIGEDMSHCDTRMFVFLDGFEFHVYDRKEMYDRLETLFGIDPDVTATKDIVDDSEEKKKGASVTAAKKSYLWRDLVPVMKFDITTCRVVFGNDKVPYSLIIRLDDSHTTYTTTPASTPFDLFMHDAKVNVDNLRVMFVKNPKYTGPEDEPPRIMGEGFVLMQSTHVNIHFYMDQPGLVPYEPEMVELADGQTEIRRTFPCLGMDVRCGKNTDFNYGPWADRQREHLWKFFYPSDYQPLEPTKVASGGEVRQFQSFEFRMNCLRDSTIDILYTKNSVNQAIHMNMGQGSYIESSVPWVTEETGYSLTTQGKLLLLEATTSMQFRSLLQCETLDFSVTSTYPVVWNDHQDWKIGFTASKASVYLIFQHKQFFQDLIEDWSSKAIPDIYHFVPFTYNVSLIINQFELITLANEYNWIDTSSHTSPENAQIAFAGDIFDLYLRLPYTDFLPVTNTIELIIKGENCDCRLYLPENNTSRHVIIAMSENMKIIDREGTLQGEPFGYNKKKQWRRATDRSAGWVDCWTTSNVALSLNYKYYPMPILMKEDSHHIDTTVDDFLTGTPDVEECLRIPLRPISTTSSKPPEDFDAGTLEPDLIEVELEVAPSVLCLYGSLLRNFLHVKENYFGEDQTYTDFYDNPRGPTEENKHDSGTEFKLEKRKEFDPRYYRPFSVTVSVTLHDIQAHLVQNCNMDDVPCPSIYVERLGFELDKSYSETKLQLLLSPAVLIARDNVERESDQACLKEGHIGLSGLQVRGHAMFSHKDLPLDSETLEYAWLVEAIIGDITGKLTSPQFQNIVEFLQTFITLVEDSENSLQPARTYSLCQHMIPQSRCKALRDSPIPCPSSEEIKYRMTRASVDSLNFYIVEAGCALNIQIYPVRLSMCNLHGANTRAGITALVEHISIKQYISTSPIRTDLSQPEIWLESGGLSLGPINAEAAMALPSPEFHAIQDDFLHIHDEKTYRLWFLWPEELVPTTPMVHGKCGCLGGCNFFGNNRNGVNFFHPKKVRDVTPTAVFRISPEGMDPGFGQSLLHKNKLVFEVGTSSGWASPSREFTFTRGYMSDLTSPDTPVTSITIVEDPILSQISSSGTEPSVDSNRGSSERRSNIHDRRREFSTPDSVVSTNPFETPVKSPDSISWSFESSRVTTPSTPDSRSFVERKASVDDHSKQHRQSVSSSISQPASPPFSLRNEQRTSAVVHRSSSAASRSSYVSSRGNISSPSRGSIPSPSRGSLPSPGFIRGSVRSFDDSDTIRQPSIVSLESEMYFSAEEDSVTSKDFGRQSSQQGQGQSFLDYEDSESDSVTQTGSKDDTVKTVMDKTVLSMNDQTVIHRQRHDSSSSTPSTLSYMSADTDQDLDDTLSGGMTEELSMVDLHGQVNKPITKSPVLLPCYSSHLTRLQCNDWSVPAPFPPKSKMAQPEQSVYSLSSASQSAHYIHSPACLPHFVKVKQGLSIRIMKAKEDMFKRMSESHDRDPGDPFSPDEQDKDSPDAPLLDNTCRTTATVKLKGSVDILVTPLLLEAFQRLSEAVTPTLTNLHPSSIIDGLHTRCLDRLKSQNRLKKGETTTDLDTPEEDVGIAEGLTGPDKGRRVEEVKTSSYQALFTLAKINVCVLQAGMVEELISFSALDNIHELTCVSLMGVCVDNIKCQLLSNSHSCKISKDVLPDPKSSPLSTKGLSEADSKAKVAEILREEDVGTIHLSSIHLQLRRLLKDSNYSDDVILTAIPEIKSKVLFMFENDVTKLFSPVASRSHRMKRSSSGRESTRSSRHSGKISRQNSAQSENPFDAAPQPKLLRQKSREKTDTHTTFGFIMFECGLEDIKITAVRRLGYQDKSDIKFHHKMEEVERKSEQMQSSTKADIESKTAPKRAKGQKLMPEDGVKLRRSRDSVHSWDSRISIPSDASSLFEDDEPLEGDASSGVLQLKTIWFNFAAPPPLPIKRKADFTRLDWNLLSTATPAINAWLNPFDRLMTSVRTLVRELTHRTNSVMACIMTEGLEVQGIHMPYKSKFSRITTFSKTLQEDASCQLLCVLRKYLHKVGTAPVERAVNSDTIPQLITIQKGILALTRQWKNTLYMPHLSQYNFKSKKHRPYTVSFAVPSDRSFEDEGDEQERDYEDEISVMDEIGSMKEGISLQSLNKQLSPGGAVPNIEISSAASASLPKPRRLGNVLKHQAQSQSSIGAGQDSPEKKVTSPVIGHGTQMFRNDSVYSFASSTPGDAPVGPTPVTPHRPGILRQKSDMNPDLYRWMSSAQKGFKTPSPLYEDHGLVRRQDSFLEAFGSGWAYEDSHTDVNAEHWTMATSIMQLADAQNLFKPFLQSIGLHVENVRPTAMMKKFGGNLSLQGKLDVLKIQIADSEQLKGKGKGKGKSRKYHGTKDSSDIPSFSCELFTVNVSMRDVVDFEKNSTEGEGSKNFPFKFAMHKLEAKPATLQVNFLLNCQAVTQHVDMPLLRLIHQFVTVIGNVNETRLELKQTHSSVDWIRTHRKQDSKGSTSSASTQQSEASRLGVTEVKSEDRRAASMSNIHVVTDIKRTDSGKTKGRHPKPSISSFKFPFDTIRPDRLTLKKPHLRFSKDSKKKQASKVMTPGQTSTQSEVFTPPQSLNLSDSVTVEMADTSSPALAEKTIVDEIKESTPQCWRTLYHLLELYSTMPETKTIGHKVDRTPLPVIEEEQEKADTSTPSESGRSRTRIDLAGEEEAGGSSGEYENTPLARSTFSRTRFKQSIYIGDSVPLVVFGIAKIEKVKILAVLSGLKLEGELRTVHASGTYKEKVKGFLQRKSSESSVTAHVGHTMIVLLEGVPPTMQTVVTVNIAKSQGLHTGVTRRGKGHNSALVSIGEIDIDIPQHPVVLHGMMTRSSRQISSTLQEFRRPITRTRNLDIPEYGTLDSRSSQKDSVPFSIRRLQQEGTGGKSVTIHIHLKAVLQGLTTGASLLPSLKAQHKTGPIIITGITVKKARFTLDLPNHTLSFRSKVTTTETSIPSSASIDLPPIHVYADYRSYRENAPVSEALTEGLVLKEGNYLNAVAEVGMFEHSLTTDLLNHLVFVQKVFMKEVNELLQKVSGADKPVPLWSDSQETVKSSKGQILYSFLFRLKGIQITATTPTSSAVRLETEAIDLEISNRVQMASREANPNIVYEDPQKVFIKAHVDLNLALGQLLKNPLFEEAEPEFQTMAFFKTKIGIRNALQDEMIPGVSVDQEALLIHLTRPIVLAQPMAFDKAVLVWLNYKNAYEYWTEQRLALNKEVQTATRQVMDRLPQISASAPQTLSTLFLQLTVDDIGLCLPITAFIPLGPTPLVDAEPGSAMVLTIENTQISACSSGSLVSKGKFTGFCLRITEDFETSLDDWKPNPKEIPVMNACVVPEGTYEVCSRTINKSADDPTGNAKWILNVKWEMQGIDVHLDTNIGKRLSALGQTLTAIAGDVDDDFVGDQIEGGLVNSMEDISEFPPEIYTRKTSIVADTLPECVYDTSLDPKQRARLIEKEMNEQAKTVQDLRELGASQTTIETESKKLEELKGLLFHDFRREVISKIKKQGERASVIKDKLGIGSNPSHIRSRSYGGSHDKKKDSVTDAMRLSSYNQDLSHARGTSLDLGDFVPTKVQFGETSAATYSPPETPESTPQHYPRKPAVLEVTDYTRLEPASLKDLKSESTEHILSSSSSDFTSSSEEVDSDTFQPERTPGTFIREGSIGRGQKVGSSPSIGSGGSKSVLEPNIDFELDIKVFIDSGQCVLHPKDSLDDDTKRVKRERTPTADPMMSPTSGRKKMKKQESGYVGHGKKQAPQPQQSQIENTVFMFPGFDVKVHYNSKTESATSPSNTLSEDPRITRSDVGPPTVDHMTGSDVAYTQQDFTSQMSCDSANTSMSRRGGVKKASLYAWLSLQSLPEEMIISPCLLDFLEQALEPIPFSSSITSSQHSKKADMLENVLNIDLNTSYASLGAPAALGSFPVDVVVYIRVEPSIIRFNCLPMSRVECLLQVPLLELVFSTKRSDAEQGAIAVGDGTPPLKAKFAKRSSRERNPSGGLFSKDFRPRTSSTASEPASTSSGGLSVTGCLSNFSLYIFHPYGGGQRKMGQASPGERYLGSIQEQSVLSDVNRKDSLSLNVEFVKVNIARSRKLELKLDGIGMDRASSPKTDQHTKFNVVRFSTVCDIGSAAFKYDMRRLSEILSFPKSWYRRNLARRLFLGDDSGAVGDEEWDSSSTNSSLGATSDVFISSAKPFVSSPTLHIFGPADTATPLTHHRRGSSGDKVKVQISQEFRRDLDDKKVDQGGFSVPQSPTTAHPSPEQYSAQRSESRVKPMLSRTGSRRDSQSHHRHTSTRSGGGKSTAWETLVLYAVNLARLDLQVNMSNVMGNTVWTTHQLKSHGRLSIDSSGHKNLKITAGLGGSSFDSKGGVVGGKIDLQDINTKFEVTEDPELGADPVHRADLSLYAVEGRVDYMGSSILMTRLSNMEVALKDEWKIDRTADKDAPLATKRSALLFAHGDLGWDKFHILISRSTTPDLMKIVTKLEEFIMQQFTSSRRALSAIGPIQRSLGSKGNSEKQKSSDEDSFMSDIRHHRHWQKALEHVTGCHFKMLPTMLPKEGMILGGTMTLRGNNLSLGCFHGINFRSKSWAIFTMNEPYICFATEAQKTQDGGTHVIQDLSFYVGHDVTQHMQNKHMAYILKLSRGHAMPPTFTNAQEWFQYAFSSSEVKDLASFPTMLRAGSESPTDYRKSRKYSEYNHDTEIIFAFPSMQLQLRTKHLQGETEPLEDETRPVVECSFVTEFEDHIFVAMDAEVILFIHDLISLYIKEKDKGTRTSFVKSPESEKKRVTDPTAVLKLDWREFECKTWQLEPTVRLLHWASKQIDPVGVDYVLQKLGFTHARVTIPKWMQRGFMDPVDKILSVLVDKLIVFLRDTPQVVEDEASKG